MRLKKYLRGVTLLELMIVVVIIGIMAAIAYPNYRNFVIRAKRNEARAMLLEIAQNEERFYLQNNTYGDMADLGYDDPHMTDSNVILATADDRKAEELQGVADLVFLKPIGFTQLRDIAKRMIALTENEANGEEQAKQD